MTVTHSNIVHASSSSISIALSGFFVLYLALAVAFVIAWVKIISKAGYSGWWVLIGLVPVANFVMFFVFAFSDWPTRQAASAQTQPYDPRISDR